MVSLHRRNKFRRTGGDSGVPNFYVWGINNVLVPQLLGRSFQKARNFTAISIVVTRIQDLTSAFSKIFVGVITPDPHSGRERPGVGAQTLVPLNFSAVVAPLSCHDLEL